MEVTAAQFVCGDLEKEFNHAVMRKKFSVANGVDYFFSVLNIPAAELVSELLARDPGPLESLDIPQYSDFEDATIRICSVLRKHSPRFYSNVDIGQWLQDDGVERTRGTNGRWGMDHSNVARMLGLLQRGPSAGHYLSCHGYVIDDVVRQDSGRTLDKMLCRLIIRSRFFWLLLRESRNTGSKVSYNGIASTVLPSQNTIGRRKNNVRKMLHFLWDNGEDEYSWLLERIRFV